MPIAVRVLIALALACGFALPPRAEEKAPSFDPSVARRIKPEEVQQREKAGQKPIIVDTRGGVSGDQIVKGAVVVPAGGPIETWAKDVPKDALIVTYCT